MSLILTQGFEAGVRSLSTGSFGSSFSIQSTTVRSGGFALRCNPVGAATGAVGYGQFDATTGLSSGFTLSEIWTRFYFRYATKPAANEEEIFIYRTPGNATVLEIFLTSTGALRVQCNPGGSQGTSATVLAANTWYRVEIYFKGGVTGATELRIDGVTEVSGTGVFTLTNPDTSVFGKRSNTNSETIDVFYDDILNSDSGFPGPGRILDVRPVANGTYGDWTAGTGASDWQEVDQSPIDSAAAAANYIKNSGAAANQVSTFLMTNPVTAGISGKVKAVTPYTFQREDTNVTSDGGLRFRVGGTNYNVLNFNFSTAEYDCIAKLYNLNPTTGIAWKRADLNTIEVGPLQRNSVSMRSSGVGAMVAFNDEEPGDGQPLLALLGAGS